MSVRIRQRIQQRSGNNTEEYQMTDQRMIGSLIVSCCLTCWKRKQKQRRQRMTVNGITPLDSPLVYLSRHVEEEIIDRRCKSPRKGKNCMIDVWHRDKSSKTSAASNGSCFNLLSLLSTC